MKGTKWLAALLVASAVWTTPVVGHAADKSTKYRVYQNETALNEFSDLKSAIAYAQRYGESYVEEIGTRKWVWNNYPRYKVYRLDVSLPGWEYATLEEAQAVARGYKYAAIRDLQSSGWIWNNYPRYRLYQGAITLDEWEFATLEEAKRTAAYYWGAHVIDLANNQWIWDNYSEADKEQLRQGERNFQVEQNGYMPDEWRYGYLGDAVQEALRWAGSNIVDKANSNRTVFANASPYQVYQNDKLIHTFTSLDEAIAYAQGYWHARIERIGREIWTNIPYYQVFQESRNVGEFPTLPEALAYAQDYSHISIRTYHGSRIWNNFRTLAYWGWNGASAADTIKRQVGTTIGLDVDSPTWFQLSDAEGTLGDTSNKDTVAWLKSQGYEVHPLVNNQFNSTLTSQFLASKPAQVRFIQALVDRAAALGVDGLNIDFESLNGKDRAAFTDFIRELTDAAHAKNLKISIDLPRGSVRWNHQTAFDHEKLAEIVDHIVTMTYDHHYSGSPQPGPVAGLAWTEEGVQEFLAYGIPRDKLIMGIPYYVREWKLEPGTGALVSNRAIYMKDIPALVASKQAVTTWDTTYQQYKVEYEDGGYRYVFWLEDTETVKARIDIAKKYDLAGVAFWRLGYETRELWEAILPKK